MGWRRGIPNTERCACAARPRERRSDCRHPSSARAAASCHPLRKITRLYRVHGCMTFLCAAHGLSPISRVTVLGFCASRLKGVAYVVFLFSITMLVLSHCAHSTRFLRPEAPNLSVAAVRAAVALPYGPSPRRPPASPWRGASGALNSSRALMPSPAPTHLAQDRMRPSRSRGARRKLSTDLRRPQHLHRFVCGRRSAAAELAPRWRLSGGCLGTREDALAAVVRGSGAIPSRPCNAHSIAFMRARPALCVPFAAVAESTAGGIPQVSRPQPSRRLPC